MLVIERTKPKILNESSISSVDRTEFTEEHQKINERIDELDTLITNLTFGGDM